MCAFKDYFCLLKIDAFEIIDYREKTPITYHDDVLRICLIYINIHENVFHILKIKIKQPSTSFKMR